MQSDSHFAQRHLAEIVHHRYHDVQFLFDLLLAYGYSMSDLLQIRSQNQSMADDEVIYPKLVYFKFQNRPATHASLNSIMISLKNHFLTAAYRPQYLIVTDFERLVAWRFQTGQKLTTTLRNLEQHYEFFSDWQKGAAEPLALRKEVGKESAILDRQAANYAKVLYDHLAQKLSRPSLKQNLNRFFAFLLFCFFAEDLGIFTIGSFTNLLKNHTSKDGKDLKIFFQELVQYLLNLDKGKKTQDGGVRFASELWRKLNVNPEIFVTFEQFLEKILSDIIIPDFDDETRRLLLRSAKFDWTLINPDIFGTIYQSITEKKMRNARGMDYTSIENVLKIIEPLFLDKLTVEFEKNFTQPEGLKKILSKVTQIRIFDPACGSGNFLIISYKKLRELELNILLRLRELGEEISPELPRVRFDAFFGIELEDLPHILAQLSLILAKYQMDLVFSNHEISPGPDNNFAKIVCANAMRINWQEFCPASDFSDLEKQVYLIGNPPYKGATKQTSAQKKDFADYFGQEAYSKNLNYIALWLIKGARYIAGKKADLAFIIADSACQGEQVGLIFPKVFAMGVEIGFAYRPFHWANNAKHQAGVDVAIMNLRNPSDAPKYLFTAQGKKPVPKINAYLVASARQTIVARQSTPPINCPSLSVGSMPLDGGGLILRNDEREELLASKIPSQFIRPLLGAEEILNSPANVMSNATPADDQNFSYPRFCLWLEDQDYLTAKQYPTLARRFQKVAEYRQKSSRSTTRRIARFPYRFGENRHQNSAHALAIPSLCSKQRVYFPMAFLKSRDLIFSNTALIVYDAPLWLFALLQSRHHQVWIQTVCSTLGDSYRYSATLAYNTFPAPQLSDSAKKRLEQSAQVILLARQQSPSSSLAELYRDLPDTLKIAHVKNDQLVDELYGQSQPDDALRLARLFELYEEINSPRL